MKVKQCPSNFTPQENKSSNYKPTVSYEMTQSQALTLALQTCIVQVKSLLVYTLWPFYLNLRCVKSLANPGNKEDFLLHSLRYLNHLDHLTFGQVTHKN